ncbi:hypothetical protein BP6252_14130 [Coleophoma cylindrospora]|uniref:Beta-xylosidase C-terminal Concanavalin A-like domain-containing protein n=1 Tax=Coleophoma cylindrospora TaxID=1849047 RepID=A0A3D8Q3T7_9HELO|nr:hypothetical protein BP6252_14130 [Coleophoma cylindrospora]
MRAVNPIVPGFAPDPSICQIGDTFYLVNSSFALFPRLPLYSSKDLVTFTHFGNAINRTTQLALKGSTTLLNTGDNGEPMLATGGLFAPTIRHSNGVTYIFCTNAIRDPPNSRKENFFVRTDDILSGNWSDPIYFAYSSIDPSVFIDDDGKAYVQGCTNDSQILCFEIDLNTGETLSEHVTIWPGWNKLYTEGAHIYKKDGWYYLLAAEGGTFEQHMVSMARSKTIYGPYESYEHNPIYTSYNTNNYVQHTGHADLFQDINGEWKIVMLGVRKRDGRFIMGRETFLADAEWPEGGWPAVKPTGSEDGAVFETSTRSKLITVPGVDWVYLRDPYMDKYQIDGANVRVTATSVPLTSPTESPTFIGKRQRSLEGSCTVNVTVPPSTDGTPLKAGLALHKDEHRFMTLEVDFASKQVSFNFLNKAKNINKSTTCDVPLKEKDVLSLKCTYTEASYEFSYKTNPDGAWTTVGKIDTLEMCGYDYIGPIFGVYAIGEGGEVEFEDFAVDKNE